MQIPTKSIIIAFSVAVAICFALILLIPQKHADQPFTTTVRVKSGIVEVQTTKGVVRLRQGEKATADGEKQPVKIKRAVRGDKDIAKKEIDISETVTGGKIAGKIVTLSGKPVAVATVTAQWYMPAIGGNAGFVGTDPQKVTSAFDGAFELTGLEEDGCYDLKVTAPGYAETIKQGVWVTATNVSIVLSGESIISGRIFRESDLELLEGIAVKLADTDRKDRFQTRETTSDLRGYYKFGGLLESGNFCVRAEGKDLASDRVFVKVGTEEEKTDVDLYLYPAFSIGGWVVHADTGDSVAGVDLVIRLNCMGYSFSLGYSQEEVAKTKSDSEGRFVFRSVPQGDYELATPIDGDYEAKEPLKVTLFGNTEPESLVVEVVSSKKVFGIVTDEEGEPLEDVRVSAGIYKAGSGSVDNRYTWLQEYLVKSGAGGKYMMKGLPADTQEFLVSFDHSRYKLVEKEIKFEANETEKVLDAVLTKDLIISGRVTDSDSQPIEGVVVKAQFSQALLGTNSVTKIGRTDAEGNFDIEGISKGTWFVTLLRPGFVNYHPGYLTVGDTDHIGVHYIMDCGANIAGHVFAGENKPLVQQNVDIWVRKHNYVTRRMKRSDAQGRFVIENVQKGIYYGLVTVEMGIGTPNPRRYRKTLKDIPVPTDDLIVQLGDFGSISGEVRDAISNEPIDDYIITAIGFSGSKIQCEGSFQSRRDRAEEGIFLLENLTTGRYRLWVRAEGYPDKFVDDIALKEGGSVEGLVILLGRSCEITGRVAHENSDNPLGGAAVHLQLVDNRYVSDITSTVTDGAGRFVIGSLGTGTYALRISHPDFSSKTIENIEIGDTASLDLGEIILTAGSVIEGRIMDEEHRGIPKAHAFFTKAGVTKDVEVDNTGFYTISGVPFGEVLVKARLSRLDGERGARILTKTVKVKEEKIAVADFVFPFGVTLSATIIDNGVPLNKAQVRLVGLGISNASSEFEITDLDEKGGFTVDGVVPGKYLLSISQPESKIKLRSEFSDLQYQHKEIITVGERPAEITISTRNPAVAGRLVDSNGKPVTDQKIIFEPLSPGMDLGMIRRNNLKYMFGSSRKDGKFSMGHITPGRYRVGASKSRSKLEIPITEIVIEEGVDINDLELVLPK